MILVSGIDLADVSVWNDWLAAKQDYLAWEAELDAAESEPLEKES